VSATGTRREKEFTADERVALAQGNHIWLNAFACIRPTPEFLQDVGASVLTMLNDSPMVDDFIGKTAVTYIRVNKS
jgi:hypothetical protein